MNEMEGLAFRQFVGSMRSMRVSPGYETSRVISLNLNFPGGFGYTHARQLTEVRELRDRIRSLAGVSLVASANAPNGGGLRAARVALDGHPVDPASSLSFFIHTSAATSSKLSRFR